MLELGKVLQSMFPRHATSSTNLQCGGRPKICTSRSIWETTVKTEWLGDFPKSTAIAHVKADSKTTSWTHSTSTPPLPVMAHQLPNPNVSDPSVSSSAGLADSAPYCRLCLHMIHSILRYISKPDQSLTLLMNQRSASLQDLPSRQSNHFYRSLRRLTSLEEGRVHRLCHPPGSSRLQQLVDHCQRGPLGELPRSPRQETKDGGRTSLACQNLHRVPDEVNQDKSKNVITTNFVVAVITTPRNGTPLNDDNVTGHHWILWTLKSGVLRQKSHTPSTSQMTWPCMKCKPLSVYSHIAFGSSKEIDQTHLEKYRLY